MMLLSQKPKPMNGTALTAATRPRARQLGGSTGAAFACFASVRVRRCWPESAPRQPHLHHGPKRRVGCYGALELVSARSSV
jgi:hypothetical protein